MTDLADLTQAHVQQALQAKRYGRSLEILARTGSTNDDARRSAQAGAADGHTIVADSQDAGRGSRGRHWVSPAGQDLYLSIVARVPVELSQIAPLTLAVGLAVADAVDETLGAARARVKWPNDVWVDEQKIAGILLEGLSSGSTLESLVIGIGLNVNRRTFPADLDTPATSLALCQSAGAPPFVRSVVLARLLDAVERWVDRFVAHGAEPIVNALDHRLALRGERVGCDQVVGYVEGISRSGALRLRTDHGLEEVFSGRIERML